MRLLKNAALIGWITNVMADYSNGYLSLAPISSSNSAPLDEDEFPLVAIPRDDTEDDEPQSPLFSKNTRPIQQTSRILQQPIPPMQTRRRIIKSISPPCSTNDNLPPVEEKVIYKVKQRPSTYHPLLSPFPSANRANSSPPSSSVLLSPPIQFLDNCNMFIGEWQYMLNLINKLRSRPNSFTSSLTPSSLCLNAKLMQAAKLQSDFQAIAKLPTHSGPRLSGFGNLEERLRWFKFGQVTSAKVTDLNDITDRTISPQTKTRAEEFIYYWPAGPRTLTASLLRQRWKEAVQAWWTDPRTKPLLSIPAWQFFGMGHYQTQGGVMYLTVILANSPTEACNICPEQIQETRSRTDNDNLESRPDDYANLFI